MLCFNVVNNLCILKSFYLHFRDLRTYLHITIDLKFNQKPFYHKNNNLPGVILYHNRGGALGLFEKCRLNRILFCYIRYCPSFLD